MLQSVNAWPKDATELYHTWVKGFKPSIHQCNYVFLIGYQLSYSLTGFLRRHKVSCYMICNFTNFLNYYVYIQILTKQNVDQKQMQITRVNLN